MPVMSIQLGMSGAIAHSAGLAKEVQSVAAPSRPRPPVDPDSLRAAARAAEKRNNARRPRDL